ncbi:PREDICTED: uncharacterized protein LOC107169314 isoform X2 [Diuraphis noxia]|uniref:uncharacterized protein LOC107169314 isoform X2 n=1 Tax=Diuraphis noxia TaxID=143948 RepID=UPI0007638234|nr:PREDICTED: uncharacterized protein LOC107169314 isoform X2 [Diuraphis noxia]
MRIKGYSTAPDLNTKKSRLGCSVCKKKIINDTPIENCSSKPWIDKKHIKNSVPVKTKNCEYIKLAPTDMLSPKIRECYCNYMEQKKIESFPKLICSKRFKTPHLTDINEKWLHEIIEFRRLNWFDCHADSLIDEICDQNIIPLNISNEDKPNCYPLNNSISLTSTHDNELRIENPFVYLENKAAVKKHLNVRNQTTVSKCKKKNPNAVNKPWIPPPSSSSLHYKF